jgi:hypothetical protein
MSTRDFSWGKGGRCIRLTLVVSNVKKIRGHHHHLAIMQLGHLMTRFGLTLSKVSLTVSPGFFCLLVCSVLLSSVISQETFCLHVAKKIFFIPVFCPKLGLNLFLVQSLCLFYNLFKCILPNICGTKHNIKMYPAVFLIHFNSAAAILLASLALMVQFSLPYNGACFL